MTVGSDIEKIEIKAVAEDNEVPIVENPPLARALFASTELDQEIPFEHFQAVAEVINYVMQLKNPQT
jgi:flagellar biosynthetic protein FlhB